MIDLDAVLLPISGAAPAGTNARYDAAFLRLEEQVARLSSLSGGIPDWSAVALDATSILSQQSKDLLAGVYLARAWYERHGLRGLRDGLLVIEDLVSTYWADGFPALERIRARRSALQWLSDGLASSIAPDDACAVIVQRVQDLLRPRFADGDTGLSGLARALIPPVEAEPSTTISSWTSAAAASAGSHLADRDAALARLREAAAWFLTREPHSPVGFLAQRAADLGDKPFHAVFRDLLTNHQPAQHELWQVLGIPPEST